MALILFLLSVHAAYGQNTGLPNNAPQLPSNLYTTNPQSSGGITSVSSLPATCTPGVTAPVQLSVAPFGIFYCSATNTWNNQAGSGSVNPVSFGAKFDGKACFGSVDTIVVTNGSNIVTCNNASWTTADIGKQFTWTNGCCGVAQSYLGILLGPAVSTTITGVTNTTTITVSQNATNSCSGATCLIAWATNDDTKITAAEAAWQTAGKCGSMNLPAGITAVLKAHFNNPGTSCLGAEPQADYTAEVDGEGIGATIIGLFPGFDFTTCTGGVGADVCFGGYLESAFMNMQWNGFGYGNTAAATAKKLLGPGLGSQWSQISCAAFGGSDANLIGFSFDGTGVRVWGLTIDGCGKIGGRVSGSIEKAYYSFFGDNLGQALVIPGGGDLTDYGSDYGVQGGTIVIENDGRYHGIGSNLFTCSNAANATAIYMGLGTNNTTILDGARFNCTTTTSNGAFLNAASNKLILTGGSTIGGTTAAVNLTAGTLSIDRNTNIAAGLITGAAAGVIQADGHSLKGTCTGVGTAASTLGLYGTGPNVTLTTCTSTTIGSGVPISVAATALSLRVTATAAGTNASSGVVTVLKNGVATTITCTIGTGTSCLDSTHSVAFADGDLISLQFTTQAADTLAGVKAQILWQ